MADKITVIFDSAKHNSEAKEFKIEPYVAPTPPGIEWWPIALATCLGGIIIIAGVIFYQEEERKRKLLAA